MQYVVSVCGFFLTLNFSCLFTAVAVGVLPIWKVKFKRFEHWPFVGLLLAKGQRSKR